MLLLQSVQIFVKVLTRQWSNQGDARIPFSESADSPVSINRCWSLKNFALLEEHWRRSTNSSRSSLTEGNYPLNTERVQGLRRRRSKTEHPETPLSPLVVEDLPCSCAVTVMWRANGSMANFL